MDTPGYEWLKRSLTEGEGPAQVEKARKLAGVARELGVPLSQLAIAWCLRNRNVSTVMLGATKAAQLEENLGALDVFKKLGDAEFAKIEEAIA
jgi:aryl-alcohol dehydrogenase-like predicted oxidoreductase